jgi:clan AA aspartic protease
MGTFRREPEFGTIDGSRFEEVSALVDTGATYRSLPMDFLGRPGIEPEEQRLFVLADGQNVSCGIAWVRVRLNGREQPTPVIFGNRDSEPLVGVVTLEEFGLAVDPVNRRLVPTPGYLVGVVEREVS